VFYHLSHSAFFFFKWDGGLNSRLPVHRVGALLLEPIDHFALVIFLEVCVRGSLKLFAWAGVDL
jgi:hypothetical protein